LEYRETSLYSSTIELSVKRICIGGTMAWRYILFDALNAMERGHPLVMLGDISYAYYLEGVPRVCHVVPRMKNNGWIVPKDEREIHWTISNSGRQVFQQGIQWYYCQPVWKRTVNRFFLISPK
jgi:hypothetical protein